MKTLGVAQLAVWLVIGAAAYAFLKWRDEHVDRDGVPPIASVLDGVAPSPPRSLDSLPKPFARLKAPMVFAPRTKPVPPRSLTLRPEPGQPVSVVVTAYCLRGRTRIGTRVHPGIVAADPRVFPLNTEIDLVIGKDTLGRFRVEDTGLLIKGRILDVWLEDCAQALAFGRKRGQATLAAKIRR
ncbi:MAG: 3D domain-containing protein [Gemmatimonas sp.]